jgi:hypothetical protein
VVTTVTDSDPLGGGSDAFAQMLYFSFVTLTSVGFGDWLQRTNCYSSPFVTHSSKSGDPNEVAEAVMHDLFDEVS